MSDSKRLRVLKLLTKWYETEISVANGYKNTPDSVIRNRSYVTEDDGDTVISILENLNPDRDYRLAGGNDESAQSKSRENWTLLIQGWAKEDPLFPGDAAYELMADVKKATMRLFDLNTNDSGVQIDMGGGDVVNAYCLSGLVGGAECEPGTVRPVEHPSNQAFFWMRVILKFSERARDPYAYK